MKVCPTCETDKPLKEYYRNRSTSNGYGNECKDCCKTRTAARAKTTKWKERAKIHGRSYRLRKIYGISEEQYETLLRQQGDCCAICQRPSDQFTIKLAVDHDHHTGEIRGLLCSNCNRKIIGRHRREIGGVEILRRASQYLEGPYTGWFVPPKKKKRRKRGKNSPRRTR